MSSHITEMVTMVNRAIVRQLIVGEEPFCAVSGDFRHRSGDGLRLWGHDDADHAVWHRSVYAALDIGGVPEKVKPQSAQNCPIQCSERCLGISCNFIRGIDHDGDARRLRVQRPYNSNPVAILWGDRNNWINRPVGFCESLGTPERERFTVATSYYISNFRSYR